MLDDFLEKELAALKFNHLKRQLRRVEGIQDARVILDGIEVLNFCSNNYLGLAGDSRLGQAAVDEIQKSGFGSGASRLVCGSMNAHHDLEERLARFKGTESCMVYNSGYTANVGIISSLFNREDIIFSDRLNHASILDGIRLSGAKLKRYPHCDMAALEELLKKETGYKKRAIITDSVFSMDGDIAPLDEIAALAERHQCIVMVDEAHAFGVLGKTGKGLVEHFGLEGKIDIQMGTLSKAAGCFGAYCCGSTNLIEYLINTSRSFIYTTALPSNVAAACIKAIDIIEQDPLMRKVLWENTRYMLAQIKLMGFNVAKAQTPIIPILIGDSKVTLEFSRRLLEKGVFVTAIRPPTVPVNTARLRLTLMSKHLKKDLDFALDKIQEIGKELRLI